MNFFKRQYFYIKLYYNKVEITHLNSGETITKNSLENFSTKRVVIANFNIIELLVRNCITELSQNYKALFTQNIMLIQHVEVMEGGVTEIEKRAMRDICEQAGGVEVYLITNNKIISIDEAMQGLKNKSFNH